MTETFTAALSHRFDNPDHSDKIPLVR